MKANSARQTLCYFYSGVCSLPNLKYSDWCGQRCPMSDRSDGSAIVVTLMFKAATSSGRNMVKKKKSNRAQNKLANVRVNVFLFQLKPASAFEPRDNTLNSSVLPAANPSTQKLANNTIKVMYCAYRSRKSYTIT